MPVYLALLFVAALIWGLQVPSDSVQALVVPLLALPQFLHYVFDAFLWRLHTGDPRWKTVLLGGNAQ